MNIPQPFAGIIQTQFNASTLSNTEELTNFFNSCFKELIHSLNIHDYQARAAKTGKMFEYAFYHLIKQKYGFNMERDVELKRACMSRGGKLDFGVFKKGETPSENTVICGIEAKGSDPNSSKRPALVRTDTIKKAIANAYLFKKIYPKLPFFIVTNVLPRSGNSQCMMNVAETDIVTKFIDVTNAQDLRQFVDTIKGLQ